MFHRLKRPPSVSVVALVAASLLWLAPGTGHGQERRATDDVPPIESIAAVRIDADGRPGPDRLGERVRVRGVAYSDSERYYGSSVLSFVHDDSGAGIPVYSTDLRRFRWRAGDVLEVVGEVIQFNGLTELSPERVEIVGSAPLPEPTPLPEAGETLEAWEGRVITFEGTVTYVGQPGGSESMTVVPDGNWPQAPRVYVHSTRDPMISLQHFEFGDRVRVVGPLAQYDREGLEEGYQIHIRTLADVESVGLSIYTQRTLLYAALIALVPLLAGFLALRRLVRLRTRGLVESESRYRSLLEQGSGAVLVHRGGRLLFANRRATELFALEPNPDSGALRSALAEASFDVLRGADGTRTGEAVPVALTTRDGRILELLLDRRTIEFEGQEAEQLWLQDVSEWNRQERERRRYETRLQEAERLESLGVLAGGIAHDFNNLMMAVMGNADYLRDCEAVAPGHEEELDEIVRAAGRASDLTELLLGFSGQTRFALEPVDFSVLVREVASLARTSLPPGVALQVDVVEGHRVEGDAAQLTQVILNLVTNAGDACDADAGTKVEIHLDTTEAEGGAVVRLRVVDDGVGMDDEVRSRIFDPFFTTKLTGRGLGLSSTLGILRSHGGSIAVASAPGRGSSFTVLLPLLDAEAAGEPGDVVGSADAGPVAAESEAPAREALGARILVVDDEAPVRRLATAALTKAGYHVQSVASGEAAVARISAGDLPDLILLDIAMPGMSGIQVLGEVRRRHPGLPVLLSSGYAGGEAGAVADPAVDFLPKPYRLGELASAVAGLLARTRGGRRAAL